MSQGIIRLKKVKVAQRNISIIKTGMYKKNLNVRFEEPRPLETIKHLSEDIDRISYKIDSCFPIIGNEPYQNSSLNINEKIEKVNKTNINENKTLEAFLEYNQCAFCQNKFKKSFDSLNGNDRSINSIRGKVFLKPGEKSDENLGILDKSSKKLGTPSEAYGLDIKIVKRGRIYKPSFEAMTEKPDLNIKPLISDISALRIVKQTKPVKKFPKLRKKNKEIIIVT